MALKHLHFKLKAIVTILLLTEISNKLTAIKKIGTDAPDNFVIPKNRTRCNTNNPMCCTVHPAVSSDRLSNPNCVGIQEEVHHTTSTLNPKLVISKLVVQQQLPFESQTSWGLLRNNKYAKLGLQKIYNTTVTILTPN